MPRLRDTDVKGIALVKHPANRRPFLLRKTATKDHSMSEQILTPPSEDVLTAIREASLSKSVASEGARETLEAIGRLVHGTEGLTAEDILAVAKAAGVEAVDKSKKEMPQFIKDKIEAKEDDGDEADDEGEEDGEDAAKDKKKTKKSAAAASGTEGEAMPADVEKAQQVDIAKALKAVEAELAKTKKDLDAEREHRLTKAIKEEMTAAFPNLGANVDHLTGIFKQMRQAEDRTDHDNLMTLLKAADAQVEAAKKSGGDITRPMSKSGWRGAHASGSAREKLDAMVSAHIAKSGRPMTHGQAVGELLETPEFRALDADFDQERN